MRAILVMALPAKTVEHASSIMTLAVMHAATAQAPATQELFARILHLFAITSSTISQTEKNKFRTNIIHAVSLLFESVKELLTIYTSCVTRFLGTTFFNEFMYKRKNHS